MIEHAGRNFRDLDADPVRTEQHRQRRGRTPAALGGEGGEVLRAFGHRELAPRGRERRGIRPCGIAAGCRRRDRAQRFARPDLDTGNRALGAHDIGFDARDLIEAVERGAPAGFERRIRQRARAPAVDRIHDQLEGIDGFARRPRNERTGSGQHAQHARAPAGGDEGQHALRSSTRRRSSCSRDIARRDSA
jgi:hypothetical protein